MKRKLCVGDRVRIYEGSRVFTGVVAEPGNAGFPGCVHVRLAVNKLGYPGIYHEKQCRRLKVKPKAPERGKYEGPWKLEVVTFKGMECLVSRPVADYLRDLSRYNSESRINHPETILVHQLKESEVIVDREKLANAWNETVAKETDGLLRSQDSWTFKAFCKLVGLKGAP